MKYKDSIHVGATAIPVTPPKRGLKSVLNYYKRKVTIAVFKVLEALKLVELKTRTTHIQFSELSNGTDLERKISNLIKNGELHFDLVTGIGVGYDITFNANVHLHVMTESYVWRGRDKYLCEVSRQYRWFMGVKTIKCFCRSLRYRPHLFNFWLHGLLPDKNFYGANEHIIEPIDGRRIKVLLNNDVPPVGFMPTSEYPPIQEPFDTITVDLSAFDIVSEIKRCDTGKAPSILDACQQIIDTVFNMIANAEKVSTSNYGTFLKSACGVYEDWRNKN